MDDPAQQREAIQTALERLLAWPGIARSPQLGRFLDYIVRRTLDGDEQSIKAYSIAVDVFGRPAEFDPQTDPIVRVQARRLRSLLEEYYRVAGTGEVIRISLPVGRYVPEFSAVPDPGGTELEPPTEVISTRSPRRWSFAASWFTLAFITLALGMAAFSLSTWQPWSTHAGGPAAPPVITVVEFQNLAGTASTPPRVAGLAIELVTDLEQFGTISPRYSGGGDASVSIGELPPSDFVLTGIVRPDGDVVQYSAILTDTRTGAVVLNHTVAVSADKATQPDVLDTVSQSLSLVLGSPRGPLHLGARRYLSEPSPVGDGVSAYLCRVLFDLYRENADASVSSRAAACYATLPETEKVSAEVAGAEAILIAERVGLSADGVSLEDRQQQAETLLQRAIGIDPLSAFVWEQQARLHEAMGDISRARAEYSSSVQLNPANVDALAAYARLLTLQGNLGEAEGMARDAAERSPSPPSWYQGVPALLALRDGDYAEAIRLAEIYASADQELGPMLAILAAQRSGDNAVVNRYLPQVLDLASFRAKGILVRLRESIGDKELLDMIRDALLEAGVPSAALIRPF